MIQKRSIAIAGHATSISLEPEFWQALKVLAAQHGQSLAALIAAIDRDREGNLSSALRVFVLKSLQVAAGPPA